MTSNARHRRYFAAAALIAGLTLALLNGCNDGPDAKKPADTDGDKPRKQKTEGATTNQAGPTTTESGPPPRPGFATGTVLREDGQPIVLEKSRVEVVIRGVSDKGEIETLTPEIRPDGSYEMKLPPMSVRLVAATVEAPFDGRQYRFDLFPVQDNKGGRESTEGIRQDFVWKLNGPRPGYRADERGATSKYGGTIDMMYQGFREDLGKPVPPPPEKTRVIFTLTPMTKLVDGRDAKPYTFERTYRTALELNDRSLPDLPLATYQLTAHEVYADGREGKLILFDPRDSKWKGAIDGSFGSDLEHHCLISVSVRFSRPMDAPTSDK